MILRYKVTIPNNRVFMREYDMEGGMNLYRLHEFLCRELGFSQDQMTLFETYTAGGKMLRRLGLFDMGYGSMDKVTLADTVSEEGTVLRYVYNINKNLYLELRPESRQEFNPRLPYPVLVAEKGRNPDQFSAIYEDYEEFSDRKSAQTDTVEEDGFEDDELPEGEETVYN